MPVGTIKSAFMLDNVWQKKQGKQAGNWFQDHVYDIVVEDARGHSEFNVRTSRRQGQPTFAIGEIITFEWSTDRNTGEFKSFLKDDGTRRYDIWKCTHQSGPTNAGQAPAPPNGAMPTGAPSSGPQATGSTSSTITSHHVDQHEHVTSLITATLEMTKLYYDRMREMVDSGDLPSDVTNETLIQIASQSARQHHIDCSYSRYSVADVLKAVSPKPPADPAGNTAPSPSGNPTSVSEHPSQIPDSNAIDSEIPF